MELRPPATTIYIVNVISFQLLSDLRFARKLTRAPNSITDADYSSLLENFGEQGALEIVMQTANFAFMNRFTDGLRLPSEDEGVRIYQEIYGEGSYENYRKARN